jgi:hypothetical protein
VSSRITARAELSSSSTKSCEGAAAVATVAVCVLAGTAELAAQWWLLLRPVHDGRFSVILTSEPPPRRYLPGYIGGDANHWLTFRGYEHSGPTAVAFAASALAGAASIWLGVRVLASRRKRTVVA